MVSFEKKNCILPTHAAGFSVLCIMKISYDEVGGFLLLIYDYISYHIVSEMFTVGWGLLHVPAFRNHFLPSAITSIFVTQSRLKQLYDPPFSNLIVDPGKFQQQSLKTYESSTQQP